MPRLPCHVIKMLSQAPASFEGQLSSPGPKGIYSEGEQVGGGQGQLQPRLVEGEVAEGKRQKPVVFPQRMRSSTRAGARWRTSRCCSEPSP